MSKHGTTEKVARIIKHSSKHQVFLNNLKKFPKPNLVDYDIVIIGSSIHAGTIPKRLKSYIKKNEVNLLSKQLALYMCCMHTEQVESQFNTNYPENLREHAFASACVGGEFLFEKMNRLEKTIIKKIAGHSNSISEIKQDDLQAFIHALEI